MIIEPLEPEHRDDLITLLEKIFTRALLVFRDDPSWKGRTGAYFCLAEGETGMPLILVPVGKMYSGEAILFHTNVMEKVRRLASHPDHLSSFQSRNPPESWGGAIRVGGYILSMSALPELGDEAVMLVLATMFLPKTEEVLEAINAIVETSENPYFRPLVDSNKSKPFTD